MFERDKLISRYALRFHVFLIFSLDIERTDVAWYRALTSLLSPEQEKALQEIILLADQRKAALESKRIEQSGGKFILFLIIENLLSLLYELIWIFFYFNYIILCV